MTVRILRGDCIELLRTLPEASVHCCVTSPPYFGLRDYGVDGQIGLEPTPDEIVAKLVDVFREVRRVLRDDGTLWLNLGDSYASSTKGSGGSNPETSPKQGWKGVPNGQGFDVRRFDLGSAGLKAKDLIGIPWRVAFALQQPYYTGSIKDERDRIWLAAMLDAEGCMFIHKRKAGQHNGQGYHRQNDNYGPGVEIANTSVAVIERIMALVGKGSICSQSPEQNGRRKQTIYRWNLRTIECREFVRELYPHLVAKRQQARILIGCPSSGERAEAAHAALIGLHRGIATGVDFPEPPTMFEPGWYLRQDLIWKKPNPMPESVRDRCTKSHEYIFLLAKSERYFFDADAIAEPAKGWNGSSFTDARDAAVKRGLGQGERTERDIRNKRSVWTVTTQPFKEAHFATFPPALIEPCILAGCPEGGTVLDPFGGAGTTGLVADRRGRDAVLIELNPQYADMAERRILGDAPLFADVAA